MHLQCRQCGNIVDSSDAFCRQCGAAVPQLRFTPLAQGAETPQTPPAKAALWIRLLPVFLVLAVAGVVYLKFFGNRAIGVSNASSTEPVATVASASGPATENAPSTQPATTVTASATVPVGSAPQPVSGKASVPLCNAGIDPQTLLDAKVDKDGLPVEPPAPRSRRSGPPRVGGPIKTPTKVRDARPVYPPVAAQARVQGIVILEVTVETDGSVTDPCVLRSIPLLDEAAIETAKKWLYTPTLVDGVPSPVRMTVTVQFTP